MHLPGRSLDYLFGAEKFKKDRQNHFRHSSVSVVVDKNVLLVLL